MTDEINKLGRVQDRGLDSGNREGTGIPQDELIGGGAQSASSVPSKVKSGPFISVDSPARIQAEKLSATSVQSLRPEEYSFGSNVKIRVFKNEASLNNEVAQKLIRDFREEGLVILPADSTHGNQDDKRNGDIFIKVDEHFKKNPDELNKDLRITHLDEIMPPDGKPAKGEDFFANVIRKDLPSVVTKLEEEARFHPINPDKVEEYNDFLAEDGGPKSIYLGLGKDPKGSHIAYIGERNIIKQKNGVITCGKAESERRSRKEIMAAIEAGASEGDADPNLLQAFSIGMGAFKHPNLKKICLTAKHDRKAAAVKSAFIDARQASAPKTGLGALIKLVNDGQPGRPELTINLDQEAFAQLKEIKHILV